MATWTKTCDFDPHPRAGSEAAVAAGRPGLAGRVQPAPHRGKPRAPGGPPAGFGRENVRRAAWPDRAVYLAPIPLAVFCRLVGLVGVSM